jgi:two-component system response regulator FixJ
MSRGLVAIVDDDEPVRLSTAELLARLGYDTVLFRSGDEFLESDGRAGLGCILLDLQMPGRNGLAILDALNAEGPFPPVLILTAHGDIPAAVEAIKLGARDFMEKPYRPAHLLTKIQQAMLGSTVATAGPGVNSEAVALVARLSERQRQVLEGIARGVPNKVMAFELAISIRTVEAYRAQLMQRLGARGTAEAVRIAIAAGLLAEPALPQARRPARHQPFGWDAGIGKPQRY